MEYGQVGNFYVTPYRVTAIVCPGDAYATRLAKLVDRGQIVTHGGPAPQYVTPVAVVFCAFTREEAQALSAAQYQTIYICGEAASPYSGIPNVVVVGRREVVELDIYVPGAATAIILDYIECAEFASEKGRFGQMATAKSFLRAAEKEDLASICASFRGADKVHDLEVVANAMDSVIAEHIRNGHVDGSGALVMPWFPLWRECADQAGTCAFYRKLAVGWEITTVRQGDVVVSQADSL